ncbi:MAG: hypothetical protein IIA02_00355 [Proteobacteria bacterium]|uniref:hypothetical protein n=1 Tax=Aquabacterium sp. TaxID=1872578 RepID=UPI0035C706BF|nr:hypothetical protein [Pseudomonadota bacterium]
MAVLIWITRATGLVPGWCWAIVVAVLAALCVRLDLGMAQARTEAATARTQLLAVQLASRDAIAVETERAQARVRTLTQTVLETQDALSQSRAAAAGRVADLDGRLRQLARPLSCRPAAGATAAPAFSGDGQPGAGLPGVAGADLVVIDGQGLADLASLAESAADTGRTLIHARHLLRECWRSP